MSPTAKPALLALLSLGTALSFVATVPVSAQKSGEVKLTVSESVRKAQADAQKAFDKVDKLVKPTNGSVTAANSAQVVAALAEADGPIAAAEAAARTNDELYVAQELRYRKESMSNAARYYNNGPAANQESVRFAPYLDKLLANPSTPASSIADYAYERGHIAYIAQRYQDAIPQFQRAKAAGSTKPLLDAFLVDSKIKLKDYAGAAVDIEPVIAKMKASGQTVPESFYAVALEQAYRSKSPLTIAYELRWYADYPSPKLWHDSLIRLMTRGPDLDLRQRMDVWRLMRATNAVADEKEKRAYAADAMEVGASREALAVLQTANQSDPDTLKLLASARTRVAAAADPAALATKAKSSSDAQSALTAGNFAYAAGNFPLAAEMYKLAQSRNAPDKDALLISLGASQAQSGDKAGAQASFQAVTGQPRKDVAAYWLAYLARS